MIKTEAYNESKQFLGLTKKNGVKASKLYTQKPLGFFSVTRNLAAYRTNQEGVLELMGANVPRIDYPITILEPARTNLILYSQEFNNASWNKLNATIITNAIVAPDGTTTANKIYPTTSGADRLIEQVPTVLNGVVYTNSIFAKKGEYDWIIMYAVNLQPVYFNINNGTIGNVGTGVSANIQNFGNGWYRCIISATSINANGYFYAGSVNANGSSTITSSGTNGNYFWGAQLETGNTATAYIPTTNAPVTVPDVIEAGCPELLVENEATNLLLRSQEFNNASWSKLNVTVNSNTTTAPDGTLTADKIQATDTSNIIYQFYDLAGILTISVFAKANDSNFFFIGIFDSNVSTSYRAVFNLSNGTYVGNGGGVNFSSYNIEPLLNGWYKITCTSPDLGAISTNTFLYGVCNGNNITATPNTSIYLWGAQLEQSNKATSYIPTTTTAVTRPADNVRNNTIGYDNEESTIFVRARLNFTTDYQGIATLWDGDDIYNGYITMYYYISGGVRYIAFDTYNGSDTNQYLYTAPSDGVYSIAFAYHTGEGAYKIAINGVLITDDTFPNNFPSYTLLTQMTLGSFLTYFNSRTKGFMYFDTMLGNDSLENLTVQ